MQQYIDELFSSHKEELEIIKNKLTPIFKPLFEYCNNQDTTGLNDCLFLSLLVINYKPDVIVEIGTWVGTTSLTMATSYDKTKVYTCDNNNKFYKQDLEQYNRIFIYPNTHSTKFLKDVIKETNIKMFFNDASLSEEDCNKIVELSSEKFIFVTHDYYNSNGGYEKGHDAIEKMKKILNTKNIKYTEYLPEKSWYFEDRINGCCALLICEK